jgi:hypothetical protein
MRKEEGKAILLSYEGCSGDNADLGFAILAKLLEILPERADTPVAIICWNNAVRLLAEDSPLLTRFRRLEEKGVKILAGESCLNELGLVGKIAVGKSATLEEILDVILHYEVVSL